jgi:hypothetical protein
MRWKKSMNHISVTQAMTIATSSAVMGQAQKFEDAFNGGCLEGADREKLRTLKQALS